MTEAIGGVSAGFQAESMRRAEMQAPERDPGAFLNVFGQGLETLSQRPERSSESDSLMDGLTGSFAGDVGSAKTEIMGGEMAGPDGSSEAANATLEDRMRGLYTELTHYQVAWKIAQNVQRDISQVLRGS